jgi:molybdopterin/thiamine biosynthesis adenylyltransferase
MSEAQTDRQRGAERRRRLGGGRVAVVGVGGLGCAAALALAEAGVGELGLVDGDRVELSNLQRQVLHSGATLGEPKVDSAAAALRALRRDLRVSVHAHHLAAADAAELFAAYDFVIDATDGMAAKFAINDAAVLCGTPYSHAGVIGWAGQTMTVLPGRSACLRCLFPLLPGEDDSPTCQTAGVIGSVVATIGAIQAAEAVKLLLGEGELLANRLLTYDARTAQWREVPLYRNPRCPWCATGSTERGTVRRRDPAAAPSTSEGREP